MHATERQELAPHVFAGRHRRRVEDLAHLLLVVADDRHAGGDRDEERVDDADDHHEQLGDRELGGDERLGAADAESARADRRLAARQLDVKNAGSASSTQNSGRRRSCANSWRKPRTGGGIHGRTALNAGARRRRDAAVVAGASPFAEDRARPVAASRIITR
jgi:hypothetical protein